ncbi:MGMT family protein [Halorubrum sp. LN27]|uniref:MGMT family protein n=1 Tax=Halorubrum sp. LN27 TaxID=2801032 RepID=UPI00190CBFDC|nr:MGMT family protein [Halorubrum sp. LN27]
MDTTGTSGVFARDVEGIERAVEVGFAGGRVISVSFPATAPDDASADHDLLDRIEAYVGGERDAFDDVETGLTVPTDRRGVLEALETIPYGEEVSVSRLTRLAALDADDPEDLELVTDALRENPIPILFPDHRVQGGPYATPGDVREKLRRVEGI